MAWHIRYQRGENATLPGCMPWQLYSPVIYRPVEQAKGGQRGQRRQQEKEMRGKKKEILWLAMGEGCAVWANAARATEQKGMEAMDGSSVPLMPEATVGGGCEIGRAHV